MAMNIQELRQAAEAGGFKFEIKILAELKSFKKVEIGIRYRNRIWAWWYASAVGEEINNLELQYASFIHTYNTAIGCIDKSFKREVSVENQLRRIITKREIN